MSMQAQAFAKIPVRIIIMHHSNRWRKTDIHNGYATLSYNVTNPSMTTNLSHFSFLVYIEII